MRGLKNMGAEKGLRFLDNINTWLRAVNTMLNPEFILTNFERDLQTALINISGEQVKGLKRKVVKDIPKAMKGIMSELRGEGEGEWADHFQSFKAEGAKTGWYDNTSLEEKQKQFEKKIRFYSKGSKWAQMAKATTDFIWDLNETVENAVRLAAYKNAIDAGYTRKQAANLAKNLTVNFNKKGEIGAALNSWYLFSNAGIQGGARLVTALKSPKVQKLAVGLVAFSFLLDMYNRWYDEDEYEKIPEYIRDTNYVLMMPNGKYLMIKLPYGYNVFNVMGNAFAEVYDMMGEKRTTSRELLHQGGRIMSNLVDAFNPLGNSGSVIQLIMPTIFDPLAQIGENKNFFGDPIRKDQPAYGTKVPESQLYFKGVNPLTRAFTDWLNRAFGGSEVKQSSKYTDINPENIDHLIEYIGGGLGRMLANTITTGMSLIKESKLPDLNKIPFVRKVVGETTDWTETQKLYGMLEEAGRTEYTETEKEQFYNDLAAAFENGLIDKTQYRRVRSMFNNAQAKLQQSLQPQ